MAASSPYSTDTEPESIHSNSLSLSHNPLPSSPHNTILLSSISENEDIISPSIHQKISHNTSHPLPHPQVALDSDDEDDFDQLSILQSSSHYKQFGDMENEEIIQDGYLEKKGERRKRWQRRWFVLRKTSLVYYKNDKEYRLLRMIPLTDIHTCAEVQVKKHDYTFGIVTPGRIYYVRAKTRSECDTWIAKVSEAKDALKNPSQLRKPSGDDILPTTRTNSNMIIRSHTVMSTPSADARFSQSRPLPAPPMPPSTNPQPAQSTSSATLNASLAVGRTLTARNFRSPLASDILADDSIKSSSPSVVFRPAISSGGSSNEHEPTNPLSSGYANTQGLVTSSEEEEDLAEDSGHYNLAQSSAITVEPLPIVGPSAMTSTSAWCESASPPVGAERRLTLPEASKTIIQGYLMKQGKRKTWRKRYFTLTSQKLVCSRTHMDKAGRGAKQVSVGRILDALECPASRHTTSSPHNAHSSNAESSGEERMEHCFKIITSDRTYLVNAPTEEDEIRWISALRCLLATHRSNHPKQFGEILDQPGPPPTKEMVNQTITAGNRRQMSLSRGPPADERHLASHPTV